MNHHFNNRDSIKTYMCRCLSTKLNSGLSRTESFTICHKEYRNKKQKAQLK